jgi:hypothetical protein
LKDSRKKNFKFEGVPGDHGNQLLESFRFEGQKASDLKDKQAFKQLEENLRTK